VVDVAVLPREVQKLLSRALAEKKCPWERPEPLDVALAVTTSRSPEELADEGELEPQLVARLGDAAIEPIRFPRLSERAEDLRALVSDALAREGLRLRGKPLGIDDRAFAVLVEHDFQGEDAELVTLARRLVLGVEGDVVGPNDVRRAMRFAADET
jgi:DNA-binding NtrC family response regulator